MALFGSPNVEKMREYKDVEGLIKALGYQKDVGVRKAAAEALGEVIKLFYRLMLFGREAVQGMIAGKYREIEKEKPIEALVEALKDNDKSVREAVVKSLGLIEDRRAIVALMGALNDGDIDVQNAAAEALGNFGSPQAVELLINALKDYKNARGRIFGEWDQKIIKRMNENAEAGD